MKVFIFSNIGARDVQLVEAGRQVELRPPREAGRRILAEYETHSANIILPIIEPGVSYVMRESGPQVDQVQVVLYGTDQSDPNFAQTDTLYCAEIARKKLAALLDRPAAQFEIRVGLVRDVNPSFYDETYEAYGQLLSDWAVDAGAQVYVILAGGTPACNTALLLQGVRRFGSRLQVVYVPQGKEPLRLRVGRQIEESFIEASAVEALRRLDFANALPYLVRFDLDPGLVDLARYAAARLDFDFQSAQDWVEAAIRDGSREVRSFAGDMRHDLDILLARSDVSGERLPALLVELYWNAAITYANHRYADFLGRVYRLQEAILRSMVETVFHLSTDLEPGRAAGVQQAWEDSISANPELVRFLEAQKLDRRPLDWRAIGRATYKAMLAYATDEKLNQRADGQPVLPAGERARLHTCLAKTNRLDPLVDLRHRTIIGHGFDGISEAEIIQASPNQGDPVEFLGEIMGMLFKRKMNDNIFEKIADFIIRQIKEGS